LELRLGQQSTETDSGAGLCLNSWKSLSATWSLFGIMDLDVAHHLACFCLDLLQDSGPLVSGPRGVLVRLLSGSRYGLSVARLVCLVCVGVWSVVWSGIWAGCLGLVSSLILGLMASGLV
jgi:hypothetical protein